MRPRRMDKPEIQQRIRDGLKRAALNAERRAAKVARG